MAEFDRLCDQCDEARATHPHVDPWGGVHGCYCESCWDALVDLANERNQSECFRGGEAAAYEAETQARIYRELK